jgi:ketosteroid isomerase-like protein
LTSFHVYFAPGTGGLPSRNRRKMGTTQIDRLLRDLYAARLSGDLDGVCRTFAANGRFQIASATEDSPVAIKAAGVEEFRPLLAFMIKTFRLRDLTIRTLNVEGDKATVHWQARVRSRITGATVATEFIDIVEVRDGRIANFNEVFISR